VQVQPARLGVGVYRGGGIETPAPIHLLWLLSLCKESNIKKKNIRLPPHVKKALFGQGFAPNPTRSHFLKKAAP